MAANEWRPVETVPRNGETVRIRGPHWEGTGAFTGTGLYMEEIRLTGGGPTKLGANDVTHWRPLPVPPEA